MPTTEERLTSLETAMTQAQAEINLRAKSTEVTLIETNRDAKAAAVDTRLTSDEARLTKLEQAMAVINTQIGKAYRKNSSSELAEDIVFSASTIGPVIKSSDTKKWRIGVSIAGALSTTLVT